VSNVVKNFNEVKKVYEQGKEYYDKLKAVNNLVKDARKVQQTVLLVGDVSEMYVQNFGKMMNDPNFTPQELVAIGNGYSALLNESTELLKELKQIVTSSSLSLNDKERMDIIDRVYKGKGLPQPCTLLHQQEHFCKLPKSEKEKRCPKSA
jgi:hypothetical protein